MARSAIQATKNYRMFHHNSGENRQLDLKKHRRLVESMRKYGFLRCFPIVCVKDKDGKLVVRDGQHRLAIAESMGLTVFWVVEETDFDPAITSSAGKGWTLRDHAEKFALSGQAVYQDGLDFAKQHAIPIGTAFALLAGTTTFSNVENQFYGGSFKAKDRKWADAVVGTYGPMIVLAPVMRNARFLEACMAACRVDEFDGKRLIQNAKRCREKLVNYSTRDAYLRMMEEVYNFGRHQMLGLVSAATMAMKKRNAVGKPKCKDGEDAAA